MQTKEVSSVRSTDRRIVELGKARRHTKAVDNEPNPELIGSRTQRMGG